MVLSTRRWRRLGLAALVLILAVAVGVGYWLRTRPPALGPTVVLLPVGFADLPGWREDDQGAALAAFLRSCDRMAKGSADRWAGREPWAGHVGDWLQACDAARKTQAGADAARGFFEAAFLPYAVTDRGDPSGLFTGYYEPLVEGAKAPDQRFRVPLYRRPPDLVTVDLGLFTPDLAGRKIAGRVGTDGQLVPYPTRGEIAKGALANHGLELFWVDDPVAAYFLEVQGSGQVRLRDGSVVRIGYAAQNGHPYRAIGKDLVEMGALPKGGVSLQSIRDWLAAHPEQTQDILDRNPSYVFFRVLPQSADAPGPLGAEEAALTPGRSLAVDRHFLPLGAPLWLDTTAPSHDGSRPLRRLVVAQDTGGAINGPVRGDFFWGAGTDAEFAAGHMQSRGRYYILLPRSLTPTS